MPQSSQLAIRVCFKVMSSGHSETAREVYRASKSVNVSCYRLCKSVGDTSHWQNLYSKGNRLLLVVAEELYGDALPRSEFFSTISETKALRSSGASRSRPPHHILWPGQNKT